MKTSASRVRRGQFRKAAAAALLLSFAMPVATLAAGAIDQQNSSGAREVWSARMTAARDSPAPPTFMAGATGRLDQVGSRSA